MATTPVEFTCVSGLSLTAELYPFGSDTIGNTGGDTATEATNRKGLYSFDVTEALAGWYTAIIKEGTEIRAVYEVYMVDDTNIHRCHEHADLQYDSASIWLDTVNGSSGTTTFLNGTPTNPVSSIADALTLAAALKISRIHVATGSSVTLAATVANYEFYGENWTLALGSQAITGSKFIGATVTGTGTTSGAEPVFEKCTMGASTLPPCTFIECLFTGTLTMGSTGAFSLFRCSNKKTSTASVQITFTSNAFLRMHGCSGHWKLSSGASGNVVEYYGDGKLEIATTSTSVTAVVGGNASLLDLGTTSLITQEARFGTDNVNDIINTKTRKYVQLLARKDSATATDNANELSEINNDDGSGAGAYDNTTDSLEAVQGTVSTDHSYQDGAVWLDTVNGTAGTTSYVNGIPANPVSTIANALTIAAALKLNRIHVAPGSSITLAATVSNYELYGVNWTLALGSQSISGSRIIGASVSGTGTGATAPRFEKCVMGACTLPPSYFHNCQFSETLTMGSTGAFIMYDCHADKAASSGVQVTFTTNATLRMSNCCGYFQMASAASGNILEWNGLGKLQVKATCTSLAAILAGSIEVQDLGTSTGLTLTANWTTDNVVNYSGYEDGAIWVNTTYGFAGTLLHYNGTVASPVDSIADALSLAAQAGLTKIHFAPGDSITLTAPVTGLELYGVNWTLALGSQDISNTSIRGATVSGTATAPTGQPIFEDCLLTTVTLPGCLVANSRLYGAITLNASAVFTFKNCIHQFTSAVTDVNFTFTGTAFLKLSECVGYFGFVNGASGNAVEWHGGAGRAHIQNTCNLFSAYLSGTMSLLDEGTSSVVSDDARYDVLQPVGDVSGKILGGGASSITNVGAWVLNDTGDPILSGGDLIGPGSTEVEIVTIDDDSNPLDGVAVWVSTDEAGTNVVAGTLYSAGNGRVKFMLDTDMNYWVWRQLSGFNFTPNPEMITLGTP